MLRDADIFQLLCYGSSSMQFSRTLMMVYHIYNHSVPKFSAFYNQKESKKWINKNITITIIKINTT
jgi:hypothetical protein